MNGPPERHAEAEQLTLKDVDAVPVLQRAVELHGHGHGTDRCPTVVPGVVALHRLQRVAPVALVHAAPQRVELAAAVHQPAADPRPQQGGVGQPAVARVLVLPEVALRPVVDGHLAVAGPVTAGDVDVVLRGNQDAHLPQVVGGLAQLEHPPGGGVQARHRLLLP